MSAIRNTRLLSTPMVYLEARRAGFWAHQAAGRAMRFLAGRGLPSRTNRDLMLNLALIQRALSRRGR